MMDAARADAVAGRASPWMAGALAGRAKCVYLCISMQTPSICFLFMYTHILWMRDERTATNKQTTYLPYSTPL